MCLGAIYWARLSRIVYGNSRSDAAAIGFDDDAIYREVAAPIEDRKIPLERLMAEEARQAFDLWESKADRIQY
jgi:tRNA(Arg) A34 adenosine deaminase TadA